MFHDLDLEDGALFYQFINPMNYSYVYHKP